MNEPAMDEKRSQMAWQRALEYAEKKVECLYPDAERRFREKWRIAYEQYDIMMYDRYPSARARWGK